MRVLQLNTYDITGGAARAAYRIHTGLRRIGTDSRMLVKYKAGADDSVISTTSEFSRKVLGKFFHPDLLPLVLYPKGLRIPWGIGWLPNGVLSRIRRESPDLIHLHWICRGFVPIKALRGLKAPIVWTLHDMWAFTGGCHYANGCDAYTRVCGCCPQLSSRLDNDLSRWVRNTKGKAWENVDLTIVTPSRWLAQCARASSLLRDRRVEVIPNGIDTDVFRPQPGRPPEVLAQVQANKKIILMGGIKSNTDPRKGFQFIQPALRKLASEGLAEQAELVVFGDRKTARQPDLGLKTTYLGHIHNEDVLSGLYACADVFVVPSVQDNLPNTVMESLACGTPCVAFDIGGISDMIEHDRTGYLARPFEVEDLAHGISRILRDDVLRKTMSEQARTKVEIEFALEKVAARYRSLYDELLDKSRK